MSVEKNNYRVEIINFFVRLKKKKCSFFKSDHKENPTKAMGKKKMESKQEMLEKYRILLMALEMKMNNNHSAKWQVKSLPLGRLKQAKTAPEHNPVKLWTWQRQCFKHRTKEEQEQLQHTPQF